MNKVELQKIFDDLTLKEKIYQLVFTLISKSCTTDNKHRLNHTKSKK